MVEMQIFHTAQLATSAPSTKACLRSRSRSQRCWRWGGLRPGVQRRAAALLIGTLKHMYQLRTRVGDRIARGQSKGFQVLSYYSAASAFPDAHQAVRSPCYLRGSRSRDREQGRHRRLRVFGAVPTPITLPSFYTAAAEDGSTHGERPSLVTTLKRCRGQFMTCRVSRRAPPMSGEGILRQQPSDLQWGSVRRAPSRAVFERKSRGNYFRRAERKSGMTFVSLPTAEWTSSCAGVYDLAKACRAADTDLGIQRS